MYKRLHSALAEAIPPQSRNSIVHGDYRIDNTILDSDDATKVLAVLDWEMSTLGDPLSDAALMCVYRHPMFNVIHASSAWASPLIPEVDDLANRYSLAAEQSLDNWDFYMALGYFKVAIIAAGIAFRARMGGGVAADTDKVDQAVGPLIAEGSAPARRARDRPSGSSWQLGATGRSAPSPPRPSAGRRTPQRAEPPRPPAGSIPTPKKWMVVESVFCRMNTSSSIRITNPTINADHSAAARVNLTADFGDTRYSPAWRRSGGVRRRRPAVRPVAGTGSIGRSAERTDRWSWVHLCPFALD